MEFVWVTSSAVEIPAAALILNDSCRDERVDHHGEWNAHNATHHQPGHFQASNRFCTDGDHGPRRFRQLSVPNNAPAAKYVRLNAEVLGACVGDVASENFSIREPDMDELVVATGKLFD